MAVGRTGVHAEEGSEGAADPDRPPGGAHTREP